MTISTLSNETTKSGSCSGQGKNGGKDFTYGKKCFTKEEWKEQVAKYSAMGELYANKTIHYPLKIQPNSSGGLAGRGICYHTDHTHRAHTATASVELLCFYGI